MEISDIRIDRKTNSHKIVVVDDSIRFYVPRQYDYSHVREILNEHINGKRIIKFEKEK